MLHGLYILFANARHLFIQLVYPFKPMLMIAAGFVALIVLALLPLILLVWGLAGLFLVVDNVWNPFSSSTVRSSR